VCCRTRSVLQYRRLLRDTRGQRLYVVDSGEALRHLRQRFFQRFGPLLRRFRLLLGGRSRDGKRLYVLLDHLTDPHNVGAIVRTAECAGADALILPDRRSAGINATVRKSAAGAAAHLPIARVANLADAIRVMKKAGIWIVGADAGPEAVEMTRADLNRDLALVVGAEGSGLAQLVKRECDYLVRIPMRGEVASLNASVAAAVLMYEALRQRT